MEHVYVSATMGFGSVAMPIETPQGVSREKTCRTVAVGNKVYQIEFRDGNYIGVDLDTLEEVVLDME